MNYRCPVCFFDELPYPPRDYHICPCCGTEFGNDDAEVSDSRLREIWITQGAKWFFGKPPEGWSPWHQLAESGNAFKFRASQPHRHQRFANLMREPNEFPRVLSM
jgi:hypothetical protein